jgi:transmembrane sensor
MIAWLRERRMLSDAASWYARMQEPQSDVEVAAFEAWLSRNPAHARIYAELDAVAHASSRVAAPTVALPSHRPLIIRPVLAVAVAVLALISAALLFQANASPAYAAIGNPGPAVRGVRVLDGTVVWLDSGAAIGVRFAGNRGQLAVRRGRVRIISRDPAKPIEVIAGGTSISPGATRMDVSVSDGEVTVGALDGPLAVQTQLTNGAQTLSVAIGSARTIGSSGIRTATLDRSWPVSRLRFARERLGQILALANRQGDPDILVRDPVVASLRVSGVFDLRDTRSLAQKLAAALDLEVVERRDKLVLQP